MTNETDVSSVKQQRFVKTFAHSATTRAVLEGDHLVINGQKIWTSDANLADWTWVLVGTDYIIFIEGNANFQYPSSQGGLDGRHWKVASKHLGRELYWFDAVFRIANVTGKVVY